MQPSLWARGGGVEYETDNSVEAFRQKDLSIFAGPYTAELRLRSFGNPAQARQHPVVGNHARVGGPYQLDVESWHTGESERLLQMMMPAGHDISDIRLEAVKQILESAGYKIVEEDWREPLDPSSGAYLAVVGNGREGSVAWHYVPGTEEEPMRDPYGLNHGAIRNQGSSRVEIEVLTTSLEASRMTDQLIAKALELWTTCPSCVSRAAAY